MIYAQEQKYLRPGFSLMELLVAVLIMGILMGIGVPLYLRYAASARENTTKTNLRMLKQNIELYRIEHANYPAKLEDLIEKPKGITGSWRPYFEKMPVDGWGQEFYYRINQTGSKHPYDLYSYGDPSSSEAGTPEARVSVWEI